jgi:hypothetical protein
MGKKSRRPNRAGRSAGAGKHAGESASGSAGEIESASGSAGESAGESGSAGESAGESGSAGESPIEWWGPGESPFESDDGQRIQVHLRGRGETDECPICRTRCCFFATFRTKFTTWNSLPETSESESSKTDFVKWFVMNHLATQPFYDASKFEGMTIKSITIDGSRAVVKMRQIQYCRCCGEENSGEDNHKKCSGCTDVWYCNAACSKFDWKCHKPTCGKPMTEEDSEWFAYAEEVLGC